MDEKEQQGFEYAKELQVEMGTGVTIETLQRYYDPLDILDALETRADLSDEDRSYWTGYLKAWD